MKKTLVNLGNIVAIFAMLIPIFLIINYSSFRKYDFIFWLVCSILYDFYMYHIIRFTSKFESDKEHYYKWIKTSKERAKLSKKKLTLEDEHEIYIEHIEGHYKINE